MSVELAYLAGLFDGDGSVRIQPRTRWRGFQLSMTMWGNNTTQVAPFIRFGGSVTRHREYVVRGGERRPMYVWTLGDLKAEQALRALYPYLRVREAHARIALEFRELVRPAGPALTDETWRAMEECHRRLRKVIHAIPRRTGWWDAEHDLTYLAGLFDAEGCVSFVRAKNRPAFWSVAVHNTVDAACLGFARYFGGRVHKVRPANGNPIFTWQRTHCSAIAALRQLRPYLTVKREKADEAIAWEESEPTPERVSRQLSEKMQRRWAAWERGEGPRPNVRLVKKEVS